MPKAAIVMGSVSDLDLIHSCVISHIYATFPHLSTKLSTLILTYPQSDNINFVRLMSV